MRILTKKRLFELAEKHSDCLPSVTRWYDTASEADWKNLNEVRKTYRDTDIVGDKTVFNIKGNDYRLIVHIRYERGAIYIKHLLTHAEYDKEAWKA